MSCKAETGGKAAFSHQSKSNVDIMLITSGFDFSVLMKKRPIIELSKQKTPVRLDGYGDSIKEGSLSTQALTPTGRDISTQTYVSS